MTTDADSLFPVALVPARSGHLARVRFDAEAGRAVVEALPVWLAEALGLGTTLPLVVDRDEAATHPLRALLRAAGEMVLHRAATMPEMLVELTDPRGESVTLLVEGRRDATGAVVLALRDISRPAGSAQRSAAIGAFHGMVGRSPAMLEVFDRIALYGPLDAPIVITGETGTGKELVARALHDRSQRAKGPFVPVNCTALSPELFESELFGHERGAFTGAIREHRGRFERAHKGTLFLDEIGDMPPMTQAKLLRALEEGTIERVGSERETAVDVRALSATNVPLEQAVAVGRFRADLFHRLNVFRIHLPPLRARRGDLPLLVDHYLAHFNRRYNRAIRRVSPDAMRLLEDYNWPGNIRELRNVVERLVVETEGDAIGARALARWVADREFLMPGDWNADAAYAPRSPIVADVRGQAELLRDGAWPSSAAGPAPVSVPFVKVNDDAQGPPHRAAERKPLTDEAIRAAFEAERGVLTRVAARLGVHKATLYRHLKRLGLSRENLAEPGK